MKKKLLIYANYFYPEVASTSQLLTDLALDLQKDFDITIICSVPCYTGNIDKKYLMKKYYYETLESIKIVRVRVKEFNKQNKISRVMHILSYFFNSISATHKIGRQDVILTISQPPILGGILGCIGKRITKGKLVYSIQDFNPEQTIAVGYSKNKLILNLMMFFDKRSCKKSDMVVTVGSDMRNNLYKRFNNKNVPNNVVINNWIDEKEIYPLPKNDFNIVKFKQQYNLENKFVIMYSGNIGLFYDLENIVPIFKKYNNKSDVVFAFIGDGTIKEKLQNICYNKDIQNVVFIPYQKKEDLIYSLNSADVHFVINAEGIKGVSCPSKIYGVMATNIPIFGILERGTEAWNIIEKSNCGILAEAGNYKDIENKLDYIILNKDLFVKEHLTGRRYLEDNFTKEKSINKYKDILKSI